MTSDFAGVLLIIGTMIVLWMLIWHRTKPEMHKLRNARIETHYRYGPNTDAHTGFVRCSMQANSVVVYDFELTPKGFREHCRDANNFARNFRSNYDDDEHIPTQ